MLTKRMIMAVLTVELEQCYERFRERPSSALFKSLETAMFAYQSADQKDESALEHELQSVPVVSWAEHLASAARSELDKLTRIGEQSIRDSMKTGVKR